MTFISCQLFLIAGSTSTSSGSRECIPTSEAMAIFAPHRSVRCYIQLRDLKLMEETWTVNVAFEAYRETYNKLSTAMKKKKHLQRQHFFP